MAKRSAKVIRVYPEAHAMDIAYVDSGAFVPMVQVEGRAWSDGGRAFLPEPTPPDDPQRPLRKTGKRDIYVLVDQFDGGTPIVTGFLPPQVSQVLFKDRPNLLVDRHPSDAYKTLEDDGSLTMAWPNGTYLKIGEDPEREDLAGADFDAKWAETRNAERQMHVRLVLKAGGVEKARLSIDPDGNGVLEVQGDWTETVHGSLSVTVDGDMQVAVAGDITSSAANWNHTGDFHLDGDMTGTGDATFDGTVTGSTDVIGGGKHLKTHTHTSAAPGSPTSPPN